MLIAAISSILFSFGYVFGRITTLFSSYNVFMSAILIALFLLVIRYEQPTKSLRKTWSKSKYGWESRILKYVRNLLKFAYFYDP